MRTYLLTEEDLNEIRMNLMMIKLMLNNETINNKLDNINDIIVNKRQE